MKGNTGKIININLSTRSIAIETLPEEWYRLYIGGSGLAAKIFQERGDFSLDPLAPEAMLIFMNGPFAGLKLSGASRGSVAGCSPLTGHWGDSSCGGYFAPELRYCGFDGLVVTGRAAEPSLISIEGEQVTLLPAAQYWGRGTEEATRLLKEGFGKDSRSMMIGPAGENGVKFANIIHEGQNAAGRAGFGALMGAKNLKAVVVKARKKEMALADAEGYEILRGDLNGRINDALASSVLRENGTAANLIGGVYSGDVPVKNWTSNFWEEAAEALNGTTLTEKYLTRRTGCLYCGIACKRIVEVKEEPFAVPEGGGPEYETIVAFGTLLGSLDLAATCKASRLCNDSGVDTISCGATIAWAMEAFEKGDLTREDTGGLALHWGDMTAVLDILLPAIVKKEGKLGALLAEGSREAARRLGKGLDYTAQSKGLEAPMHDPRGGGYGLALTYAMSARGTCHVADPMLFIEMGARYYPEIGFEYILEPQSEKDKAAAAAVSVALGAIENSACFCQFADAEVTIPDWLALFKTVAGYEWDAEEFLRAGRRIFYLKRLINGRYGLSGKDDDLTPRMRAPGSGGEADGARFDLEKMKARFYEIMKIDPESGLPTKAALADCGMADELDKLTAECP
ncbi:MAG: aldehyde ferredoxin oxidoreductase family protein [Syntrophobacterales bacterium]|nr:aldehyde ferredoxin oxidoreductase family protein [Syntrophobacterales bacterium]